MKTVSQFFNDHPGYTGGIEHPDFPVEPYSFLYHRAMQFCKEAEIPAHPVVFNFLRNVDLLVELGELPSADGPEARAAIKGNLGSTIDMES
jgi:hypothetical protein